jgi:hypothetical protein
MGEPAEPQAAEDIPVFEGDDFFEGDSAAESAAPPREEPSDERELEAAVAICAASRQFLARRALGERIYDMLDDEHERRPKPAVRRIMRMFPAERLPALIAAQRHHRARGQLSHQRSISMDRRDDLMILTEAIEEAGLYPELDDEQGTDGAGRAFLFELDQPFAAETATALSLDDLHELNAVLNRNLLSIGAELRREQQQCADLSEQCERRERLVEQIVFKVGKHYRARKAKKKPAPVPTPVSA